MGKTALRIVVVEPFKGGWYLRTWKNEGLGEP